jgi:hypothetical protein
VGDVYWETITYSKSIAKILDKTIYLKGKKTTGWKLYDEPPDSPYFIIESNGQATEIE